MKLYTTAFEAKCAKTGDLLKWCGQNVEANSFEEAQNWCYENAGHLIVEGELVAEEMFHENHTIDRSNQAAPSNG